MAKMSSSERREYYSKALAEQRHLLRTAIDGMAAGDLAQALHVATSVRVLVHETAASKPLLKHLDNNYLEIPILERTERPAPKAPPGKRSIIFYCPVSAELKAPEGTVSLITELRPEDYTVSKLGVWWAHACMMLPGVGSVTRRELILGLSNKEGGAHVDADISEKYKNLLESKFVSFKINDVDLGPLRISRLVAGRVGVELLNCLNRVFPA